MSSSKRYNVCAVRKYRDRDNKEKTHFWRIGTAFPMREQDGLSLKLYTRILPSDELVLFVQDEQPSSDDASDPSPDDDIPY